MSSKRASSPILTCSTAQCPTNPLLARVYVGVDPCEIADLAELLLVDTPFDRKLPGMLQINAAMASHETLGQFIGFSDEPVAIAEFVYADAENGLSMPLRIDSFAKEIVKQNIATGFTVITASSESRPHPRRLLNMRIRRDKENQLLLRTEMRDSDIHFIRDSLGNTHSLATFSWNEKRDRETIYEMMLE
ncbi:hypothetical protein K438DRAFT_1988907 [Mycena galopus ATCC 62051]|nr:hypothetical protein K438DRAFT_1988907 [Mycena galopus ATCC 62051]